MKKPIIAVAALLVVCSLGFGGCRSMTNTGRISNGRISSETTTESKLKKDAGKIKDDVSEAASDAGDKIKEKFSEAGSTVKEGLENASEDLSRAAGSRR